jgi:hypothetical protein
MSDFYAAFAAMAAGRRSPHLPAHLDAPDAPGLKVYRNNVAKGAAEVLAQAYPAVARLVGERFFTAMAAAYRDTRPPATPVLALYGETFDAFIEQFEPARSLPYLTDIARLDRAWLEAHHAADAETLTLADLAEIDPDALGSVHLALHPSAHVLAFDLPAYSIWRTNREDVSVERVRLADGAQTALVWRRCGDTLHRQSTAGQHAFLSAIRTGASLFEAAAFSAEKTGAADPVSLAFGLVEEGLFERTPS